MYNHPLADMLRECPEFFYERKLNGLVYCVPNYVTWEVKRAMEQSARDAYRAAEPEECKPDIDFEKFNLWLETHEMERNASEANVLFVPKDAGTPPACLTLSAFRKLPFVIFSEARNFFERPLPLSDSAPMDASVPSSETPTADTPPA